MVSEYGALGILCYSLCAATLLVSEGVPFFHSLLFGFVLSLLGSIVLFFGMLTLFAGELDSVG